MILCPSRMWPLSSLLFMLAISSAGVHAVADSGTPPSDSSGIVYIVFAIDTEPARIPPWDENPVLDFSYFSKTGDKTRVADVMDKAWRGSYRDSFGGIPRITWFILSQEALFHARGGYGTIVYDSLLKFADEIDRFGDEIGWHYHHADWIDLNRDGKRSWNQLTTYNGSVYTDGTDIEIAERSLNVLLVERHFFPTVFRAGWAWENNGLSDWLEDIVPFDFSANPPNAGNSMLTEPLHNVYDWTQAPAAYTGYHPSRNDYRKRGTMHRWIFRTIAPNTKREWGRLFNQASIGHNQVFCFTAHTYDDIRDDIDAFLGRLLRLADSLNVRTKFATASMAAAALAGTTGIEAPRISIIASKRGVSIQTESPIFQRSPYCVLVDSSGVYNRVHTIPEGPGRWHIDQLNPGVRQIVCAVSNLAGNSGIAVYPPD
jgi:hypothetical protein